MFNKSFPHKNYTNLSYHSVCIRLNNDPHRYQHLIPGTYNVPLFGKWVFANVTKLNRDPEIDRWLWLIQVYPKCNHKKEAEGNYRQDR